MILPGCDLLIRRDHIPGYFTPPILNRLQIWINWKLGLGLPLQGGWRQQPEKFMAVLDLLIAEHGKHLAAKRRIEEALHGRHRHG